MSKMNQKAGTIVFNALAKSLSDVDGLDTETIDVHDLARRTLAETLLSVDQEYPGLVIDVSAEAEEIRAAGFDPTVDAAEDGPGEDEVAAMLAALFGPGEGERQ